MAVDLSANLTEITNCDSATNWSSSNTIEADTEVYKEGIASIGLLKASQATVWAKFDYYTANGSYLDLTDEHIFFWFNTTIAIDTKANGGIQIYVEDLNLNWSRWTVGGSDNYYGGWQCFVVHTGEIADNQSATPPDLTQIQYVGFYAVAIGKTVVNENNMWCDIFRYGTGLVVKGGTSTDKGTFDEIAVADDANSYGVLVKRYGCFILQGAIVFGDDTGTTDTYFKDESQIILFADARVSSTLYEIKVVGNSTGINSFELGNKSGNAGISGCIMKSIGDKKFKFTATDANVNVMKIYGCSFLDASTILLPANATDKEVLSSNFEGCGEFKPDTCIVKYCKFISADDNGIQVSDTSFNVTDCDFISCPNAIEVITAGTYTFDALKFSGNTVDIDNTSGGSVIVNCTNGSNPSTSTGDTTINNAVNLIINVKDESNNPIEGASCAIYKTSDDTQLMNELSDVNGVAQETFNYTTDTDIYVRIRKASPGTTKYFPYKTTGTITSSGYTLTAVLIEDSIAT
jgi:hypothetical protein